MLKKTFSNKEIAKLLEKVSASYEILNDDFFRVSAYQRAAVSIEHSTSEAKDYWDEGKLEEIPGIGKSIAGYLDELFKTGKVKHFESLFKKIPASVFVFMDIPGIGPKTAWTLAKKLKITSGETAVEKLKSAAESGKIRKLENFGEKSEIDILKGISSFKKGELKVKRMPLYFADSLAGEIIAYLKKSSLVIDAHPLGSLRRKVATIGDIDISVCTEKPEETIEYLLRYEKIREVLSQGEESLVRLVLTGGQQVDFRFSKPENYGSMLQYFTGSKQHNIELRTFALKKGLSLSEYGIKKANSLKLKANSYSGKLKTFRDEKDFYNELGLEWIPPELREASGEIEAAKDGKLPKLVELEDIKGDLHIHSNFDIESSHDLGESSSEEIIEKARGLGYEYLGFSEHNPSVSKHSEKQIIDLLKRKKEYIEKLNYSLGRTHKLLILNGLEIDIKPDGSLAVPDEGLALLDYAVASVHSSFDLSKEKMTARVLKALPHPKVLFLGHPTGRLLETREGYELDWDEIFDFCQKNNKYLEISAWPNRLDLPDSKVREAVKYGVKLVINSDSHEVSQMEMMRFGVSVAKRGWAQKSDIINTLSFEDFNDILS